MNGEGTMFASITLFMRMLLYMLCYLVGDMIAMGSQNGSIYLFRVSRDGFSYKKVNKIRGSQPLTHLDWSVDGCFVQTVTVDFDLLFCRFSFSAKKLCSLLDNVD